MFYRKVDLLSTRLIYEYPGASLYENKVKYMQTHIQPTNRLASLGTVGLLFLAGIAGMVFLLPASPVHAATPTVTLSTTSNGILTTTTSGTPGSILVISGAGFDPAAPITITTPVGTTTVAWLTQDSATYGNCATTNGGTGGLNVDSLVASGCLTTTSTGNFRTEVAVPNLPAGAQSVSVSDGVNTATATYTITPSISITYPTNYGFPGESITPTITVVGFGAAESVTIATSFWSQTSFSCTTGNSASTAIGTGYGSCKQTATVTVLDTTGGNHTITATGATTGLTTTTTYQVNPWAAFYNAEGSTTTFSFLGSAPTSLVVSAHGLPAGTISANSITVGGVGTAHPAVIVGSSGAFGGAGAQLVLSPTSNVPFGNVAVVIDGITFSYAAGNIALPTSSGITWGGALISSILGTAGTGTGVVSLDKSSYMPGTPATDVSTTSTAPVQNQIALFGYGFDYHTGNNLVSVSGPTGFAATWTSITTYSTDVSTSGAIFATALLGDTPWSTTSTPSTATTYTPTVSVAYPPSNTLNPSYGITPWIDTSVGGISVNGTATSISGVATVDYRSGLTLTAHGFGPTDVITFKVGGTSFVSQGTCTVSSTGWCTTASSKVPDLASGLQSITATGSISGTTATAPGAVDYVPLVDSITTAGALSINSGGAGTLTILRTGISYGVHGLAANTAYTIVLDGISGSVTLGSFTSTSTGGVPVPGVQFKIPGASSGIHLLDIQTASGSSAIFGTLANGNYAPPESPFNSPIQYYSAYGDLLFSNIGLLSASPSVAVIGQPESLTGSGLSGGTNYVIALGETATAGTVSTTAPALGTFTATAAGDIPSGTTVTLTDTATTLETGTLEYMCVQSAASFGVSTSCTAYAQFVLAASATLNMSGTIPAGHAVALSAHALNNAGAVYHIVFNYVQSSISQTSYTGTTVGVVAPNSVGAGSATFDIPAGTQAGTYPVELVVSSAGTGGAPVGTAVLDTPLSVTVGSVSSGSCNTTSCFTSPAPSTTQVGANQAVQTTFTDNSNGAVTAVVFAVVHNALGQTVSYSTATVTASPGGSATAYNVLYGLAPGTYTVTIFATSTSGTAISNTSTVSVTIP